VNTEVIVLLLHCHVVGHREVFEPLLLLLGITSNFLVLILLGVLDTSVDVVLELLDVFDDPIDIVFSFF
jgi:hypothetical protein